MSRPTPGDREIERRIKSWIRWNAMAMVVRANTAEEGIGGHISTYASSATLCEVGFNHFFRGKDDPCGGDIIYFQGHASPGIYSRAFLEGRLSADKLDNFRRELAPGGGLSSYPHPWSMPDFWEFPTVLSRPRSDAGAVPRALHALPRESRSQGADRRQGLVFHRRRRNGRAGDVGLHLDGGPQEARQPRLRHQLQFAAPRWAGARQRSDHPRTRGLVPGRRVERHQSPVECGLGPDSRTRRYGPTRERADQGP